MVSLNFRLMAEKVDSAFDRLWYCAKNSSLWN